ncbi:MAG: Ribosomal protein S2 [uncultured bacterium]|nr:MAG: Ribosomal protein S2 [uncultured bacterium]HBD05504.1 30S ribosomal protein S2 [Candidatus Uhrbacteria bacterium]
MPKIPSLVEMLEAGVHFGHRPTRWHPKMNKFIFGVRSDIHIINIEETQRMLERALNFVSDVASRGGNVLFVGTKKQAQPIIEKYAKEAGMPYVTNRWLGGTLTNFSEIKKLTRRFTDLKDKQVKGELKKYTKKEQLLFAREIDDMNIKVGGIEQMLKLPDAVFIADMKHEKTARDEAISSGVKIIALCDTNINPEQAQYPIPANDDSVKSIDLITRLIAEAVKEGKEKAIAAQNVQAAAITEKVEIKNNTTDADASK